MADLRWPSGTIRSKMHLLPVELRLFNFLFYDQTNQKIFMGRLKTPAKYTAGWGRGQNYLFWSHRR